ncbi:MAG: ribonuclease P protein component [Clostridia bacterium]
MKKVYTLKKNYEFKNVLKKGKYYVKKHVIAYINKNNKNKNVIGIAVNTKLCNAVKRNHIKRIIREAYYREAPKLEVGYDIVFLWNKKTSVQDLKFHEIHYEISQIFEEAELIEKN